MLPLHISSRLLAAFGTLCLSIPASTVTGTIEVLPGSPQTPAHSRTIRSNLSDIVVWLQPVGAVPRMPVSSEHFRLLQKDKMFHPHVLAIRVGTIVDFPNADPIFHNAFSNYDGQLFDVGLYPPGTTRSIRFRRPGIVRVFCNIHPAMSAVIVALDTPYFANIHPDGRYQISDVPPGSYEIHVFDERATRDPGSQELFNVEPNESQSVAPRIQLGEAGYVQPPHKNKFGLDYPLDSTDSYSGLPR